MFDTRLIHSTNMIRSVSDNGKVLITGGTSGLGLQLAKYFLEKGYEVVATGRKNVTIPEYGDRFSLLMADFSDMRQTSEAVKKICRNQRFDIVINNAGVLSPPDFMLTDNGLEYTFQVNFLSHFLLDEIILKYAEPGQSLLIAATVSPVYRIAEKDLTIYTRASDYWPLKAYSNSKLYLALMCSYIPQKYPSRDLRCIGFDPGVFSSGIYRMQKEWFRILYRIASPFMKNPEKVAVRFGEVIEREDLIDGAIFKSGKGKGRLPVAENKAVNSFWKECNKIIEPYVS
jgi:NAD(P)-dependent dehydrogenase (short-subunit alcohol dehydrogenase family)